MCSHPCCPARLSWATHRSRRFSAYKRAMASGAVCGCSGDGGRGHLDCHEELLGGDAQELNACGFLLCLPCKLYPPRVPQWYVPCKKACVFTLRVGGGWPCRGPCFNVKNHRGDHVCRYHWGVLPENCPADSPMDTRRTLEVHSICASNGCIPRWVVRRLIPKHPRGKRTVSYTHLTLPTKRIV